MAPVSGDRIALDAVRDYAVHWLSEESDPDALGVDLALDANRPRRLPASDSLTLLGSLASAGEELAVGEHWLFAAPISASGLIPRRSQEAPRSAIAVRFQIGDGPARPPIASGAVWLRKPEGTYNGSSSEHVLFDAQAFSENGAPLATPCAILLRGRLSGELHFAAPFSALLLASGDYEISAAAPGLPEATARFITVNPELGRPK